jgi:hypothetical protein
MSRKEDFIQQITEGYSSKGESIILGGALLDGEALGNAAVKNTVKTLNRHGLIATGTGKTKPFKYFLNNYLLWDTGIDDGHQR